MKQLKTIVLITGFLFSSCSFGAEILKGQSYSAEEASVRLLCTNKIEVPSHLPFADAGKTKISFHIFPKEGSDKNLDVGHVCVSYKEGESILEISLLEVAEDYRRKHYAETAMGLVFGIFEKKDFFSFTLSVAPGNEAAKALYKKLGFILIKKPLSSESYLELVRVTPLS